jgi:hypothetical protein
VSGSRTTWRAKPCGWRGRERVVALGEEHGPAGPLVLDVLEELAKEQRAGGRVRTGLRSLTREAFLERGAAGFAQAREILAFAESVGALDELEVSDDVAMTVTCRVSGFEQDQGAGHESVRKAQQRAKQDTVPAEASQEDIVPDRPAQRDNAQDCPAGGDTVPTCPPTGQERTGQKEEEARAGALQAVEPPTILAELRDVLTGDDLKLGWDDMAVQHALDAHPWASDGDLRAAACAVASWAAQSTDGPRFRHAARLLRTELDQMDSRRTRTHSGPRAPGAPPRIGGARASAPDRAAEFRRAAEAERAKEASA